MSRYGTILAGALCLLGMPGCTGGNSGATPAAAEGSAAGAAGESGQGAPGHEHEEAEEEAGKDIPLDELATKKCEHGIVQLDCDECRYELGAVKVPDSVDGALIKPYKIERRSKGRQEVALACEVQADDPHSVQIAAPVAGRVESVRAALGEKVSAGDVLATLYSDDFVEIRKEHLAAHQAHSMALVRMERLERVQENLESLVDRLGAPLNASSPADDLAKLVIGSRKAEVVGAYSTYAAAASRFAQETKRVADTRKLLSRLDGQSDGDGSGHLVAGEWKEVLLTAQADLRLARKSYERVSSLREKGIASQQELDAAGRDLDVARARFQAGKETVRLAADTVEAEVTSQIDAARASFQAALEDVSLATDVDRLEAQQDVDRSAAAAAATHRKLTLLGIAEKDIESLLATDAEPSALLDVRAPTSGEIIAQSVRVGQTFGQGSELFALADLSTVWVWCGVYDRDLGGFLAATPPFDADVTVSALPGRTFTGELDYVGRVVDEQTRTVRVRIVVPNTDSVLRPGMFASATVMLPAAGGHPLVRVGAVLADEGRSFVFKPYKDGFWIRRGVTPGRTTGQEVEILEGVALGETVAGDGAFLLKSDVLRSKMGAGCAD
jgi:RND family efflux transporter MFP subunit